MANKPPPTPVTILTGFLGSGKTTLILNLLPQLPKDYKLALLKNEFGDVAIDSQLAGAQSIEGVRELTNGCICCNLVGQLGDALEALRTGARPDDEQQNSASSTAKASTSEAAAAVDRIVIETSGSAFPATLAMEVNRLAAEGGGYVLDGVVSVVDAENWAGYEDTSVTAALQARYTDMIIINKWEAVDERRLDEVVDRIRDIDIDPPVPIVKSDRGRVGADVILGVDGALARKLGDDAAALNGHAHGHDQHHHHDHEHSKEVEVLSITVAKSDNGLDVDALEGMLKMAPKDEVYRIKGIIYTAKSPKGSDGQQPAGEPADPASRDKPAKYILNWAFGRWTYTHMGAGEADQPTARITVVTAPYESNKWQKQIESGTYVTVVGASDVSLLKVEQVS